MYHPVTERSRIFPTASYPSQDLTGKIIGAFFEVHRVFGFGHLEAVYRRSMAVELDFVGISAAQEVPFVQNGPVSAFPKLYIAFFPPVSVRTVSPGQMCRTGETVDEKTLEHCVGVNTCRVGADAGRARSRTIRIIQVRCPSTLVPTRESPCHRASMSSSGVLLRRVSRSPLVTPVKRRPLDADARTESPSRSTWRRD